MAAAAVHLLFGSPGGRPSLREVTAAVRDLGVDARDLRPAELQPAGVWTVLGEGAAGEPLVIKVYGRDAWDTQLVTQAWRFLWYRHSSARLRHVPRAPGGARGVCCSCWRARRRSTCRRSGRPVGRRPATPCSAIEPVAEPGAAGDARPPVGRARRRPRRRACRRARSTSTTSGGPSTGDGVLSGWAGGTTAPDEMQRLQDRAQLLVATTLISGRDAAIDAARAALGDDGAAGGACPTCRSRRCLPRCAAGSTTSTTRSRTCANELSSQLGIEEPELVQLRRVTVGSPSCRRRCWCWPARR